MGAFRKYSKKIHSISAENKRLKHDNALLQCIVDSTSNGVIVVDSEKRIQHYNNAANAIFEINSELTVIGSNFMEVVRNYSVNMNIDKCLDEKITFEREIFFFTNEQKNLKLSFHPTDLLTPYGCIMFIEDLTNIKKLAQIRTEFVSNVTHELKTPLTSIRGFIETLRNGAVNDPTVANSFLEIIDIEAERLYMLINDILHLSEIESRQMDDNIVFQPILPIIKGVIEILAPVASKKNIKLSFDISPDAEMGINSFRLKQLLINLVDNGIKYNIEGGFVKISCHESIGKLTLMIEDSGIGIAPEHHNRLFERFYTVDKSRSRKLGGTGLGLSIVKHIVNLYAGNIFFTSAADKGTTFVIEFPVSKLS